MQGKEILYEVVNSSSTPPLQLDKYTTAGGPFGSCEASTIFIYEICT